MLPIWKLDEQESEAVRDEWRRLLRIVLNNQQALVFLLTRLHPLIVLAVGAALGMLSLLG